MGNDFDKIISKIVFDKLIPLEKRSGFNTNVIAHGIYTRAIKNTLD